jgi:hypothetical protein
MSIIYICKSFHYTSSICANVRHTAAENVLPLIKVLLHAMMRRKKHFKQTLLTNNTHSSVQSSAIVTPVLCLKNIPRPVEEAICLLLRDLNHDNIMDDYIPYFQFN